MSDDILETVRATVQESLLPMVKTCAARLESLERRSDDTRRSLEQRLGDLKSSHDHRLESTRELLRAEIKTLEAKMDGRFAALENRLGMLELLIRSSLQQVTLGSDLPERMASLEARLPRQ